MQSLAPWAAVVLSALALLYSVVSSRSKAATEKVAGIEQRVDRLEDRATKIEADFRHLPDISTTHRLEVALEGLRSDVRVVAERMNPIASISDRLQTFLLEQAERK